MVATDPTGWTSHTDDFHRGMTWKLAVRCATTASITIATALNNADVLDGVTLATGDRVLVKDQATGSQNGIYIVSASPARAPDMDQDSTTSVPAEEVMGAIVYVIAGTVNAGTAWRNTNTTAPTIGTTALTFAAFGGASGAVTTSGLTMATARLLGRTTAATGAIEEITVGSGLSLAAGSLTATGSGSGTVTTVEEVDGTPTDSAVTKIVFPNGTLAIASHVATYTPTGGSGGGRGEDASKYNPDHETPTTAPDLAEEFNGSTGMAWVAAPGVADVTTYPGFYRYKNATTTSTERFFSIAWTPGASDITIACKLRFAFDSVGNSVLGLAVANTTGNPTDSVMLNLEGAVTAIGVQLYTRATSTFTAVGAKHTSGASDNPDSVYLRLTRLNSGPTWTGFYSADGITWHVMATTSNKALTVGAIHIRIDADHDVAVDWIRAWKSIVEKVGA